MDNKKFNTWMNSIDEKYLEEAAKAPAKKFNYRHLAMTVAACLVLAATGLLLRQGLLPEAQPDITDTAPTAVPTKIAEVQKEPETGEIATKHFTKDGVDFTLLSCDMTNAPTDISGMETANAESLVWVAGGLEIKLCSTTDTAWASWYDANQNTQWCLKANASTLDLLTTAKDIVEDLGYNLAVAPEGSSDITYNAFLLNDLTVAETTFLLDGIRYSFRMASTYEIAEDFEDISGTADSFDTYTTAEVGWCPAKIYYNKNREGKIIWFDIVPGLLYSLSMETNASEEALLTMAHELFVPAQDAADW